MNKVGTLPTWFPGAARQKLGDLSRFDTLLDQYGVGEILSDDQVYEQDPVIAANREDWHADFKDHALGYFPAKVALTERLIGARTALEYRGGIVKSLQLPADTIADFAVQGRMPLDSRFVTARLLTEHHAPSLYPEIEKDIAVMGIGSRLQENKVFSSVLPQQHQIVNHRANEKPYMHMDQPQFAHPGIVYLASNSLVTLGPEGIVHLNLKPKQTDAKLPGVSPAAYFSNLDTVYDRQSVKKLALEGKIIRQTGWDVHTRSYGEYARTYFTDDTAKIDRVLAFILCTYTSETSA